MSGSAGSVCQGGRRNNTGSPRLGQSGGPTFRCSPCAIATIPVSKGWMPELKLARLAAVLENGQADHGTGHTPTMALDGFKLSKSPIWTKFRRETRCSILPIPASTTAEFGDFPGKNPCY